MKYIQVRGPARALSALAVAAVLISAVPFRLVGQSAETPPKSAAPPENASGKRGLVRPAALSARRAGVVEKIFFREGDPVKKGEVLLQIDAREAQATLATAEARFRLAEATFRVEAAAHHNALRELKRQQQLAQVGRLDANDISDESLIQAKFDRAQAEFELAKHALAQNQMELNYYRIISPRDGTVLKLDAEEGETVVASADRPLLVVGDAETAEMRRAQLEQQIQILEDQKAELRLRYTESHPRMREIDEQIAALHFKTSPKAPTHVFVLGEVNKPGAFLPLSSEHLTIFGLLARAGGLSSRANPAKIKFTRPGESERVFSLADLKKPEHQFAVEPGDMVEVVSKLF